MSRTSRWLLPVIGGAIAGGVIALAVASEYHQLEHHHDGLRSTGVSLPTSLNSGKGMTVNQIYRAASPGVVDIQVTSQVAVGWLWAVRSER